MSGMPLLSGPPPPHSLPRAEISCRKCNKEFNVIFTRSRRCNHCGYSYCSSCSDYQALMPRQGSGAGWDPVPVCAFCIENLNITAGGRNYIKSLPLARLKRYADSYGIPVDGILEKDELVQKIVSLKGQNGCLPQANEDFYRKQSVPNRQTSHPRGLFSRAPNLSPNLSPNSSSAPRRASAGSNFARPDLEDARRQQPSGYNPRSQAQPPPQRAPRYAPPPGAPPTHSPRPQYAYSNHAPPPTTRPRTASHPPSGSQGAGSNLRPGPPRSRPASAAPATPPQPPPPVPTLDELVEMSEDDVTQLSIGTLKSVLFQNHVNARNLLEKSELIGRVRTLVEDERRERARDAAIRAREEEEIIARQHAMMEEHRLRQEKEAREREAQGLGEGQGVADVDGTVSPPSASETPSTQASPSPSPPKNSPPLVPSPSTMATLERNGLCVICQDEDANIAIVDCGHLAMCRSCSELVMKSSRECPLCRTRIVTEQRLLRIFKT